MSVPPEFPGPPSVTGDTTQRLAQGCVNAIALLVLVVMVFAGWVGGAWYLMVRIFGG